MPHVTKNMHGWEIGMLPSVGIAPGLWCCWIFLAVHPLLQKWVVLNNFNGESWTKMRNKRKWKTLNLSCMNFKILLFVIINLRASIYCRVLQKQFWSSLLHLIHYSICSPRVRCLLMLVIYQICPVGQNNIKGPGCSFCELEYDLPVYELHN